jgi:hypothetical protein
MATAWGGVTGATQTSPAPVAARRLLGSLIRHLHAFVRETRPSPEEWLAGLDLLARTGHACTEQRNEFILLSDMPGLTSAVDDVNFVGDATATPSSVEGPFHSPAPPRADGDRVSSGPERDRAEVVVVRGRVTGTDGTMGRHPMRPAHVHQWTCRACRPGTAPTWCSCAPTSTWPGAAPGRRPPPRCSTGSWE